MSSRSTGGTADAFGIAACTQRRAIRLAGAEFLNKTPSETLCAKSSSIKGGNDCEPLTAQTRQVQAMDESTRMLLVEAHNRLRDVNNAFNLARLLMHDPMLRKEAGEMVEENREFIASLESAVRASEQPR